MDATLKFNLPEDQDDFERAVHGTTAISVLFEIKNNLWRKYLKHGNLTDDQYKIAEKIFEDINNEINIELLKFL